MQPTLRTERLLLRPWTPEDVEAAYDLYRRWDVVRYLGTNPAPVGGPEEAAARIERWQGLGGPWHGVWAIVPTGTTRPVGSALSKLLPLSGSGGPSGHTEIGWHLHPDVWGNGYATEAGRRLLDLAWAQGAKEVFAVTNPSNVASQAVCLRIGMTALGQTDRFYDMTCEWFGVRRPAG